MEYATSGDLGQRIKQNAKDGKRFSEKQACGDCFAVHVFICETKTAFM
jgi:hypothetical protein